MKIFQEYGLMALWLGGEKMSALQKIEFKADSPPPPRLAACLFGDREADRRGSPLKSGFLIIAVR